MGINTYFQKVQGILVDPSDQGKKMRKQLTQAAGLAKAAAGALIIGSGVVIISSVVACIAHPILGTLGLVLGSASLIASYEGFIIARNIQVIARGAIVNLGNLINRVMNAVSPDAFVASILKDTLVVDSLFREYIVEELTR